MLRFKEYLVEAKGWGKNLHLEHLEDEVLNNGINGTRGAQLVSCNLYEIC